MHIGCIAGATNFLGAPKDWDREKDGHCGTLPVRAERTTAGIGMTSAWFPDADEIARIVAGAPIYLTVLGVVHPPVEMAVGPTPEE